MKKSQSPSVMDCACTHPMRCRLRLMRRSPHLLWIALVQRRAQAKATAICRSPHLLWIALVLNKLYNSFMVTLVAVPICYGLRLYDQELAYNYEDERRSPHLLWIALVLTTTNGSVMATFVAVPICYGLRLYDTIVTMTLMLVSQSPSVMDCACTVKELGDFAFTGVAVPICYGLRLYL